jgi:Zn-dependent protease
MSDTPATEKTWLNGLLFVLTVLTTYVAGLLWSDGFFYGGAAAGESSFIAWFLRVLRDPRLFPLGASYSAVLMTILVGHELGHYITSRRYGLRTTLPFFLPGIPFLGTFGAFIRIKSPIYFKRQVFDVGANGPLVGFALSVPALAVGLALSRVAPYVPSDGAINFGEPLLLKLLMALFFGPIPEGSALVFHPIGWAGWVGLLVTGLNLMPFGQLDGGHVAYAILGRKVRLLSKIVFVLLVLFGLFFYWGWFLLLGLILFLALRLKGRPQHPPVLDEGARIGLKRSLLAAFVAVIFVLSFIPDLQQNTGLIDLLKGLL